MKARYKETIPFAVMILALSASLFLSPIWGGRILFWIGLVVTALTALVVVSVLDETDMHAGDKVFLVILAVIRPDLLRGMSTLIIPK